MSKDNTGILWHECMVGRVPYRSAGCGDCAGLAPDFTPTAEQVKAMEQQKEQRGPSYTHATSEEALEEMLAGHLMAAGWQVLRQVNCVPPFVFTSGAVKPDRRRVDIYAVAGRHLGYECEAHPTRPDPMCGPCRKIIRRGTVVVIELKHTDKKGGRWKVWHEAEQQALTAISAHDYWVKVGSDGRRPLRRPDIVLVADQWTIGEEERPGAFDPFVNSSDRRLWRSGCAVLRRLGSGLYFSQHIARQDYSRRLIAWSDLCQAGEQ